MKALNLEKYAFEHCMKKKICILLIYLIAGNILVACNTGEEPIQGTYRLSNEKVDRIRRGWNSEYWTLKLNRDIGSLSFNEAATNLHSFSLAVKTTRRGTYTFVKLDSIITQSLFPWETLSRKKLDTLAPGMILLTLKEGLQGPKVIAENITPLQHRKLQPGLPYLTRIE